MTGVVLAWDGVPSSHTLSWGTGSHGGFCSCPNICAAGSHPLVFLCFVGRSSSSFHAGKHAQLRLLPLCPLCLQATSLLQPCPISLSW